MMTKCSYLSTLLRALDISFTSHGRPNHDQEQRQVSVLMMFCHMTSILLVVIGIYAAKQTSDITAHFVNWFVVMGFVLLGLISMAIIFVVTHRQKQSGLVPSIKERDPSINIRLVFLWIFGLAVMVHVSLYLAIIIDCGVKRVPTLSYFAASFASDIILLMFLIVQLGLITCYRHGLLRTSSHTDLAIVPILLANFSIWFNTTVSNANNEYIIRQNGNVTIFNSSYCFVHSKIQTGLVRKVVPYLLPARMEFCILASDFIMSLWSLIKEERAGYHYSERETCIESSHWLLEHSDTDEEPFRRTNRDKPSSAMSLLSVIFGLVSMLPTFISSMLLSFVYKWKNDPTFITLQASEYVNSVTACILIFIINYHLNTYYMDRKLLRRLDSNDYFLILSSSGLMAYHTFGFLTGIYNDDGVHKTVILVTRHVFSMIETYLQTSLLVHMNRFRTTERSSPWISSCAIVLFIINLTYWFLDSYVFYVFFDSSYKVVSKRIWIYVEYILVPLLIFYRFSSAMKSYCLYHKFKSA